jgi:hypothetical protein
MSVPPEWLLPDHRRKAKFLAHYIGKYQQVFPAVIDINAVFIRQWLVQ